ncbi:hypothetical protein Drorol1_Dr00015409 [Drosera rotundifolia]
MVHRKEGWANFSLLDKARKDPAQIVVEALHCFSDGYVYRSCEESYRLTVQGDVHVPSYYIDQFCTGPCLAETNVVLNCIDEIMSNFEFYNMATIQDVRDTITAGCSYGSKRGRYIQSIISSNFLQIQFCGVMFNLKCF